QIRAGAGLAVALTPADLPADDLRQVLALLLLAPVAEQHRPEHPDPEALQRDAAARGLELGLEDRRLGRGEAGAAVLLRPGRRGEPARSHAIEPELGVGIGEDSAPAAPHVVVVRGGRRAHRRWAVLLDPAADLGLEAREIIHGRPPSPAR